nr:MAG TPA: hypothetical protein [Caudoviricetes sp.]
MRIIKFAYIGERWYNKHVRLRDTKRYFKTLQKKSRKRPDLEKV